MQPITHAARWTIVVPLKASRRGKSRIDVDPLLRRRLVLAMALDTVAAAAAAAAVAGVLVVVEDPADGGRLSSLTGVRTLLTARAGLNEAIDDGLRAAGPGHVAVLPGDLPSLTSGELDDALDAAGPLRRAVVADRQGVGSTLLAASGGSLLRPQYGAGSLARHVAGGAVPLEVPLGSGLRRDVDRVCDLEDVTGTETRGLLIDAGWAPGVCSASPAG